MHILSGTYKGRKILVPKRAKTRPTSSRMRAQLFDICQDSIDGALFLDLFSGSGAMGLEALSRGARLSCFVDSDPDAMHTIKHNIRSFNLESSSQCLRCEAIAALYRLEALVRKERQAPFDIVFIDPPYSQGEMQQEKAQVKESQAASVLNVFDQHPSLTSTSGRVFLEESRSAPIASLPLKNWEIVSSRRAGNSCLYEFKRTPTSISSEAAAPGHTEAPL